MVSGVAEMYTASISGFFEQLAIVGDRALRPGRLGDLGEALGPDLREMQALREGMGGAGLGADAAAPARADDRYADLLHGTSSIAASQSCSIIA